MIIFISPVVLIAVALIVLLAVAGGGGGLAAGLTALLITIVSVVGGAIVLGVLGWFLTRGVRQRRAQARAEAQERARLEYEDRREQRRLNAEQQRAIEQARVMAPMVAMITAAMNRDQPPPVPETQWHYQAEVVRTDGDDPSRKR